MPMKLLAVLAVAALGGASLIVLTNDAEIVRSAKPVWCPTGVTKGERHWPRGDWDAREVLGLKVKEAEELAARNECSLRQLVGDGIDPSNSTFTADHEAGRVNVEVRGGVVVRITSRG
jgi:hypothetical protein